MEQYVRFHLQMDRHTLDFLLHYAWTDRGQGNQSPNQTTTTKDKKHSNFLVIDLLRDKFELMDCRNPPYGITPNLLMNVSNPYPNPS